jgi:hypothetical protein
VYTGFYLCVLECFDFPPLFDDDLARTLPRNEDGGKARVVFSATGISMSLSTSSASL